MPLTDIQMRGFGWNEQDVALIQKVVQAYLASDGGTGLGLPPGGTTGQVLAKNSATDGDASWVTAGAGGGPVTLATIADMSANARTFNAGADYAAMRGLLGLAIGSDVAAANHTHSLAVAGGISGFMSGTDKTKLDGIAAGATVNDTDVNLRNRALHTGTQLSSTIGDFAEAVDDRVAALIQQGNGITCTYNDVNNTFTIALNAAVGGGNVFNSGTPVAGQAAEWLSATGIQGIDVTGTGNYVKNTSPTINGIPVYSGSYVTTANAMQASVIDTSKALNTRSISVNTTFTFSSTPPTANTWFHFLVRNTDTVPHVITFPSAFSQVTQDLRTTCPIAATGRLLLLFFYDGTGYYVFGDSDFFSKYDATAAPAVTDDTSKGYGPGSIWYNATANVTYICEVATAGAAVWTQVGGAGGGDALTTSPLSQFASTTSAQLAGVMSDETGTGSLVFANSPVLVTPNIGTPSGGTLTNCSGLPQAGVTGLTAALGNKAATAQTFAWSWTFVGTASDGTIPLFLDLPAGATLTNITAKTDSGTCTIKLQINGVDVTNSTIAVVSGQKTSATPTAANVAAAGNTIAVVISSSNAPANLAFTVDYTTTLAA